MRIAFQGEPGAYSEAAALEHFGRDIATLPCETFDDVFAAVEAGSVDTGLVPIENSLGGSIHRNYDLLMRHSLAITAEHYLRVRHCLIGLSGATLSGLRRVISHPQGLAQTEHWVRANLAGVQSEPVHDTAGSVRLVREGGDPTVAAIASRRAAEVYGLPILVEGIEDDAANYTRFLAIRREPVTPDGDAKTSLVFTVRHQPGSLFKALSVFALRDIDLTKIESRPLAGRAFEYLFYVDIVGSQTSDVVRRALDHLSEYAAMLRVLGSYPRHILV
ncbi:MAG TPA: prephenate dehydratase [Anaerolineales bacterium]|nr:prephenate dehydratase [Anaerolineales bacterium]